MFFSEAEIRDRQGENGLQANYSLSVKRPKERGGEPGGEEPGAAELVGGEPAQEPSDDVAQSTCVATRRLLAAQTIQQHVLTKALQSGQFDKEICECFSCLAEEGETRQKDDARNAASRLRFFERSSNPLPGSTVDEILQAHKALLSGQSRIVDLPGHLKLANNAYTSESRQLQ